MLSRKKGRWQISAMLDASHLASLLILPLFGCHTPLGESARSHLEIGATINCNLEFARHNMSPSLPRIRRPSLWYYGWRGSMDYVRIDGGLGSGLSLSLSHSKIGKGVTFLFLVGVGYLPRVLACLGGAIHVVNNNDMSACAHVVIITTCLVTVYACLYGLYVGVCVVWWGWCVYVCAEYRLGQGKVYILSTI